MSPRRFPAARAVAVLLATAVAASAQPPRGGKGKPPPTNPTKIPAPPPVVNPPPGPKPGTPPRPPGKPPPDKPPPDKPPPDKPPPDKTPPAPLPPRPLPPRPVPRPDPGPPPPVVIIRPPVVVPQPPPVATDPCRDLRDERDGLTRRVRDLEAEIERLRTPPAGAPPGSGRYNPQKFIDVSGQPPPQVFPMTQVAAPRQPGGSAAPPAGAAGAAGAATGVTRAAEDERLRAMIFERMFLAVVFVRTEPQADSAQTIGNGVLLNETHVLTAWHVAKLLAAAPEKYSAHVVSDRLTDALTPVPVARVTKVGGADDPDLAVVRIEARPRKRYAELTGPDPRVRQAVVVVGASQFNRLMPDACTGFVTTVPKLRALTDKVRRTAFGTNTFTFPGVSGSPCYDLKTGQLLGIQTGSGADSYAGRGERRVVVNEPEERWEAVPVWTWVVPVGPYAAEIRELAGLPAGKE